MWIPARVSPMLTHGHHVVSRTAKVAGPAGTLMSGDRVRSHAETLGKLIQSLRLVCRGYGLLRQCYGAELLFIGIDLRVEYACEHLGMLGRHDQSGQRPHD